MQGVSTRKVKAITEELCGHSFSASAISQINKKMDDALERFACRHLDEPFAYVSVKMKPIAAPKWKSIAGAASENVLVAAKLMAG